MSYRFNKALSVSGAVRLPFALFLVLMALTGAGGNAAALPAYREAAMKIYAFKPGGVLDKAQCTLCHTSVPQLNPYGLSVKAILPDPLPDTLTAEQLHSLDGADADGDGFTNGFELQADTLPGDAQSHPAGAPPSASKMLPNTSPSPLPTTPISPFDLKVALFAKNAQHPVLIHFPIALFIVSVFFDLLGVRRKNAAFTSAGYLNLCVAAISSLAAVATGLIAWQWMYAGAVLEGNLRLHLILGIVSALLICILWGIRFRQRKEVKQILDWKYLLLGLLAVACIALTGHIGGILSGVVRR